MIQEKISIEANMKPDTREYSEKAINVEEIIADENKSVDIHKLVKYVLDSMEENKLIHGDIIKPIWPNIDCTT